MTEKQQVIDKLSYWWKSIVHAFWYFWSAILYGKSDTEVLERSALKKKAAKRRVLTHELKRAERSGKTEGSIEDTSDLKLEVTSITQEMKAVRDTGPHRAPDHVPRKASSA